MSFDNEKRTARRILAGIEDGKPSVSATFDLINEAEPVLVSLIFGWIRAWYPSSHPAADGVLGRLAELCTKHPKAARMAKEGESDSIVAWFEDQYGYRDFRADEFVELIVEKLEG